MATYDHFTGKRLQQKSPFSYSCHRCSRCCRRFAIPLTPFDLLRLADALGVTTTEAIERYLDGTNRLQRREDGACIFLTETGCSAHGGRPLVCRMYPLARNVAPAGEWFTVLAPVVGSEAEWGEHGTVADYLEEQGALASIEGYDVYSRLHSRLAQRFEQIVAKVKRGRKGRTALEPLNLGLTAGGILDPDPAIENYCRQHDLPVPSSLRHKAACHVQAIEEWAENKLKEIEL